MNDIVVIAIHGAYSTHATLAPLTDSLRQKGILIESVTLPWHDLPLSKQEEKIQDATLLDYVTHVEKITQKKKLQHPQAKVILLGHSMGTSVAESMYGRNPEAYAGLVYLAPTAGLSLLGLVRLCVQYGKTIFKVALGRAHKIPFKTAQKAMMNATPPGIAGNIFKNFTFESGKVLREIFIFRTCRPKHIPALTVFGLYDNTIMKPRGKTHTVLDTDHMGVVPKSQDIVYNFIQTISEK